MVEQVNVIKADTRTILGSAESRRLRNSGFVPATIRNGNDISYISIDQKEFEKKYFSGSVFASPIIIELEGKKIEIITKDVEIHPVSDRPIHADFIQINKDQEIIVKARVNFTGQDKSPALKRGGFLHVNVRMVEVICKNIDSIIEKVDIDVEKVPVGGKIRSDIIQLPENTSLKKKNEFLVASILGRGGAKEDKSETEEEGAEGGSEADSE
jgi:large subunit ribosomal protein L25